MAKIIQGSECSTPHYRKYKADCWEVAVQENTLAKTTMRNDREKLSMLGRKV